MVNFDFSPRTHANVTSHWIGLSRHQQVTQPTISRSRKEWWIASVSRIVYTEIFQSQNFENVTIRTKIGDKYFAFLLLGFQYYNKRSEDCFIPVCENIKHSQPTCLLISFLMSSYALSLVGTSGSRSKDSSLCVRPEPELIEATGLAIHDCPAGTWAGSNPSHTSTDKSSPIPLSDRTASRCVAPRRLVPLTL